jgi:pilus assembly protein CpaE
MNVYLVTDDESTGTEIRKVLLREGLDCPVSHIVGTKLAPQQLAKGPTDLIVVVLPDHLEQSLGTLEMIERLPQRNGTRVLAVGSTYDPKLVLRALRGAADDFVDESDLDNELQAALERWRASQAKQEQAGRVISFLAPSGGSGSSTLAVNLATLLAKQYSTTGLIDLKLETGDLAALLDLKPSFTLADLCQNLARLDRTLFERSLTRHSSGVHLLAPPRHIDDIARITSDGVHQTLLLARSMFPYVLIDLDHSFRPEQAEALCMSDLILLVLRLDFAALRNTRRAMEYLDRLGISRERIRLVVNRYGQPKEVPAAKAEEALGMKVYHYVPDDPKSVNRANNNGVPVVVESPRASVSKSLAKLAVGVNGRLHEH